MSETEHGIFTRLYRGETSFDFVGRRRRWFLISGTVIAIGLVALLVRGLNFSIDFKGGTVWEVQSNASVAKARSVIAGVSPSLNQSTIEVLTNRQNGAHTLRISATANETTDKTLVTNVSSALATMAHVNVNDVTLESVGPTWGGNITQKAERALVIFLIAVVIYITFRFEAKMAIAALVALVHDILVTLGVYALSGFQVSPDTVIAFLTILGYSLYDTVVVFDKIEENTKGLASSGRITYTDTVNLSMNQVLMRSINTSIVAIMPVLSILVIGVYFLGASALQDFGLALFIGLLTGAYSSIFIASPLLAVLKEREPRYSQIRQRLAGRTSMTGVLTPAAAAAGGGDLLGTAGGGGGGGNRAKDAARAGNGATGGGGGSRTKVASRPAAKSAGAMAKAAKATAKAAPMGNELGVAPAGGDGQDGVEAPPASARKSTAKAASAAKPAASDPGSGESGGAGSESGGSGAGADSGSTGSGSTGSGSGGGGSGSGGSGGGGSTAARQPAKPRPGAPNRPTSGSRPAPRPRKKGRKR